MGKYIQVISANPNRSCKPGYCQQYVREDFGKGNKPGYPSAISAWGKETNKHASRDLPKGVSVPVYWSPNHVALAHSDGFIYTASHPTSHVPLKFGSLAALESYYRGKLKYLGWGEHEMGDAVVRYVEDAKPASTGVKVYGSGYIRNDAVVGRIISFLRGKDAGIDKRALGNIAGPFWTAAVKKYQKSKGLTQDGNVGPITMAKLKSDGFKG